MVKFVTVFMALVALVIAGTGIAQSAVSSEQSASDAQYIGGEDRLFGGGRFVFDFGPGFGIQPRDFGISATANGLRGFGTMYYGHPDRPTPSPGNPISCLEVEGGRAVVGGAFADGTLWVRYFNDQGPAGPAPPDQVSPVLQVAPGDPNFPKHYPSVCPAVTPPADWGTVFATLDTGDIAVVDG